MIVFPPRLIRHPISLISAPGRLAPFSTPAGLERQLPAWPLVLLLAGFPVWWAMGAAPFMPSALATVMLVLLFLRRRTIVVPGLLPWGVFLLWVLASAVALPDAGSVIAFAQRAGNLVAVGVFMLYIVNAPERLTRERIISGLLVVWATVIGLGLLAMAIPEARLHTPIGAILPNSLVQNDLVRDLVFPPMAEIQQPWGAPEPYIRPAAPFPYANSWGVAFAVLTPVVVSRVVSTRRVVVKMVLLLGIAVSFLPALATSNRGMLLGLAGAVVYVTVRLALRGRYLQLTWLLGSSLAIGTALVGSNSLEIIFSRQEYSDSTGGRLALYGQTLKKVLESPFLGYGSPRMEPTVGVSMGTQGYVWMLMFSYGFVGLSLFIFFLVGAIIRTRRAAETADLWLHSVLIAMLLMIPFYSFSVVQLSSVSIVIALLLRERYRAERTGP